MKQAFLTVLLATTLGVSAGVHAQTMNGGADGGGTPGPKAGIDPGGSNNAGAATTKPGKSKSHASSKPHGGGNGKSKTLGGGPLGAGAGMSGSDSSTGATPSAARAPTTR